MSDVIFKVLAFGYLFSKLALYSSACFTKSSIAFLFFAEPKFLIITGVECFLPILRIPLISRIENEPPLLIFFRMNIHIFYYVKKQKSCIFYSSRLNKLGK